MNEYLKKEHESLLGEVNRLMGIIKEQEKRLEESEGHYNVLQDCNNQKWTEIQSFEQEAKKMNSEIESLKNVAAAAKEDKQYWMDAYMTENTKRVAEGEAYLKVIRNLTGRD